MIWKKSMMKYKMIQCMMTILPLYILTLPIIKARKNDYLTVCSTDNEIDNADYENKTSENENQMSESPSYLGEDEYFDYLHPYSSLIRSKMEKPNIYFSLKHINVVQPVQGNPASVSTCQAGKKTHYFARRWSFTISDLSFNECNKEVSNVCLSSFQKHLSQTEIDRLPFTNSYEPLVNDKKGSI
ncbi:unnamed protein product [Mytilus edulis]|uniref:Uncharacterized protein n=1 Tax=Mytilus edulis TaxID=6550 RepID=A0A8S3S9N8_MYTED|nr:unnamed protein product [Mytilus edulis]